MQSKLPHLRQKFSSTTKPRKFEVYLNYLYCRVLVFRESSIELQKHQTQNIKARHYVKTSITHSANDLKIWGTNFSRFVRGFPGQTSCRKDFTLFFYNSCTTLKSTDFAGCCGRKARNQTTDIAVLLSKLKARELWHKLAEWNSLKGTGEFYLKTRGMVPSKLFDKKNSMS